MTFVPQPYEQFVSDLLTSLTGGRSREEHQYVGSGESYQLTARNIFAETLRVAGERNETFATFEAGIDYLYDADANAIRWKPGGRQPDDRSYFYVSYYTQEAPRRLTDRNPGSVTTTLAEAFSRELAVLHRQMSGIYESAFVDLAAGSALDHVVALLGLIRKNARFASGEVLFKRSSPSPGDIAIPAGTVVSAATGQNFETTDKRTLRRGQLAVTVPIRAQVEGPPGRVDAAAITNINRPIFGIDSVVNEAATFFASDKETDEELRRRARGTLERAGKSTVDAIRYALIEDLPEVSDANIQVVEKPETPGYVEVRLGIDQPASPDLVARVEESIFNARPAGVRVLHNLPTGAGGGGAVPDITRPEALADLGAQGGIPDLSRLSEATLESMPSAVLRVRVEVFLRLADANLSAAQKESIEDGARSTVVDYLAALPMGAPLVANKLLGRLIAPDTVADVKLLVGAAAADGHFESVAGNLDTSGRKARAEAVFVGLMEELVRLDVIARVEKAATATADAAITDAGQTAVAQQVAAVVLRATSAVARADVLAAVRAGLTLAAPDLQLIADNPVVVNARYEETGRLLNDTDTVPLAEHERAVLDAVTLKLQGELDG
jgi:uncharacterized phage protein gp47/JayE